MEIYRRLDEVQAQLRNQLRELFNVREENIVYRVQLLHNMLLDGNGHGFDYSDYSRLCATILEECVHEFFSGNERLLENMINDPNQATTLIKIWVLGGLTDERNSFSACRGPSVSVHRKFMATWLADANPDFEKRMILLDLLDISYSKEEGDWTDESLADKFFPLLSETKDATYAYLHVANMFSLSVLVSSGTDGIPRTDRIVDRFLRHARDTYANCDRDAETFRIIWERMHSLRLDPHKTDKLLIALVSAKDEAKSFAKPLLLDRAQEVSQEQKMVWTAWIEELLALEVDVESKQFLLQIKESEFAPHGEGYEQRKRNFETLASADSWPAARSVESLRSVTG